MNNTCMQCRIQMNMTESGMRRRTKNEKNDGNESYDENE